MRINNCRWAALAVAALMLAGCGPSEDERLVELYTEKAVGSGMPPIVLAMADGNVDAARALIEAGAD